MVFSFQNIKIGSSSLERVENFKYLGITLTNQNSIQEEINSRLQSGNACYYSVQNLLSSSLLSKNTKIKIYRAIIMPVVLCGCENWPLTVREERRLRVFEDRVLRRIFGPRRSKVIREWSSIICTPHQTLFRWSNQEQMMGGAYSMGEGCIQGFVGET